MVEVTADLWEHPADYRCVTTNGCFTKYSNELIMGAGTALQAKKKFPELPKILHDYVKQYGNRVFIIEKFKLFSFPTKNDWKDDSLPTLIEKSCQQLVEITNKRNIKTVSLSRPGCGCGGLLWENVKPILEKYLDSRFTVCSKE